MPLPHSQLAMFHRDLASHEQRVYQLREGIRLAQEEIEFHQLLLNLTQDPRILTILDELHDRPDLIKELSADPMQYVQQRGVSLPDGGLLGVQGGDITLRLRTNAWGMNVGWSVKKGFWADPPEGPAACLSTRFLGSVTASGAYPD